LIDPRALPVFTLKTVSRFDFVARFDLRRRREGAFCLLLFRVDFRFRVLRRAAM
jgi:hypothetical protein